MNDDTTKQQRKKARKQAGKCPICLKDLAPIKDDLLKTLGLDKPTENNEPITEDDIKQAFKNLAKQHHPDKQTGDAEKFQEIRAAKDELLEMIEEDPLSIRPIGETMQEAPTPPPQIDIVQMYHMKQAINRIRATQKIGHPCSYCHQR